MNISEKLNCKIIDTSIIQDSNSLILSLYVHSVNPEEIVAAIYHAAGTSTLFHFISFQLRR